MFVQSGTSQMDCAGVCQSKMHNVCAKWRGSDGLCGSGSNPAAQGGLRPPAATLVSAPETNRIAWCRLLNRIMGGEAKDLRHKSLDITWLSFLGYGNLDHSPRCCLFLPNLPPTLLIGSACSFCR